MACVAPKNNSVVIKMNKPSPGFFKRHGLVGVINGNEGPTAGNTECVYLCVEWVGECLGLYVQQQVCYFDHLHLLHLM